MTNNEIDILLVEDNPNDVKLTLRALRKQNLANNIQVAKDGEEALEIISSADFYCKQANTPKLILLDLKLPKINGLEVLEQIKSNTNTKCIPVVILTSSREDTDLERCYELGANSYIVKPVEFDKFIKAVIDIGLYWLLLNENPRI